MLSRILRHPFASADDTQIRWATRQDLRHILAIEADEQADPWTEADIRHAMRRSHVMVSVAEHRGQIIGFVVYEIGRKFTDILKLTIRSDWRRQGVGTQIVSRIVHRLDAHRGGGLVTAAVCEVNLGAQLFFKSQGFVCDTILCGRYEGADGRDLDAYLFRKKTRENEVLR